jgi:hypothetical protein
VSVKRILSSIPELMLTSAASFLDVLHQSIQEGLKEDIDEVQRNGALQVYQGWMHVHGELLFLLPLLTDLASRDARNPPALGRIGDPDDIIASVLVEDGKVRNMASRHLDSR